MLHVRVFLLLILLQGTFRTFYMLRTYFMFSLGHMISSQGYISSHLLTAEFQSWILLIVSQSYLHVASFGGYRQCNEV